MARYRLNVFLANGKSIRKYNERIIKEMDKAFADGLSARNPKELMNRYYDEKKDCVVVDIYSAAELSSPGHLLSNVSKSLLKSDEKICLNLGEELLGKRLFKIEAVKLENCILVKADRLSDCKLMEIISTLLLEEVETIERNKNKEVINEIKKALVQNQFVVKKFGLENQI